MSNLGPLLRSQTPMLPTPPTGVTIARYETYVEAQRAVDFLSDNRFPVRTVTIVGTDLRMVERVTGRLTYGRTAFAGALSGAWFGLFVGLFFSLFDSGAGLAVPAAMLIGAGFGMFFGVVSYAATRGRRDFSSQSQIVASEYQVLCHEQHARAAMDVLGRLTRTGVLPPSRPAPPPVAPVPPAPPREAAPPASPAPPEQAPEAPPVELTGPTYGEIMEQRRRERQERERREREGVEGASPASDGPPPASRDSQPTVALEAPEHQGTDRDHDRQDGGVPPLAP